MDRFAAIFWGLIIFILAVSLFYIINIGRQHKNILGAEGKIDNGGIVRLIRAINGDTVTVMQEGQRQATVRILGIKSFDTKFDKDIEGHYGEAAIEKLKQLTTGKSMRVMLNSTPKDKYGRFIATLYVDDEDIGLHLVREGLAIVYTVYPFPAMSLYLQEQETARSGKRGLWSRADTAARAYALIRGWQRETQ